MIHICIIFLLPFTVWGYCEPPYEQVGDQCLYFEKTIELTHPEAIEYCNERDYGGLVTITTPTQFKALVDHIYAHGLSISQYWVDGSDAASEGVWVSSAGVAMPMGTPFWAGFLDSQEPSDSGLGEDCVLLNEYYYLNDYDCTYKFKPICEEKKNNEMVKDHSSNDDPCPMGFVEIAGECLSFHTWELMTWPEARLACSDDRVQLAIVNDIEVLRGIYLYLHEEGLSDYDFWLGGTDEAAEGEWKWVDESPVPMGTPFWGLKAYVGLGQEPDGDVEENYLALLGHSFYFRDVPNDSLLHPLCQYY